MADATCVAAGFFVTRTVARDANRSPDLLPPRLVSLSRCIAPSYQVYWGWDLEKHRAEALAFGVPEHRMSALHAWEQIHGISYPNVFHSLDDARAFVAEFVPATDDLVILGAALPAPLVDAFLVDEAQQCADAHTGTSMAERYGVNLVLTGRRPLPEGGERLGFEIVLCGYGLECSWLCTGTERAVFATFGIAPNQHGLIETPDDALRIDTWLGEHPEQGEPGPYYPWLLVRYPLRSS